MATGQEKHLDNGLSGTEEFEFKQEGDDGISFVISELFMVKSEDESENDFDQPNISSQYLLLEPTNNQPSGSLHTVSNRNIERLGKAQRMSDTFKKKTSQSARDRPQLFSQKEQISNGAILCKANLSEHQAEETVRLCGKNLTSCATLPQRTRRPTQKMLENLCRLCEQQSYGLVNIFGAKGSQLNIVDKIHLHLPITVRKNDKLPQGLCTKCVQALKMCNDLYQTSLRTDCHLREVFLKEDPSKFFSYKVDSLLPSKESASLPCLLSTRPKAAKTPEARSKRKHLSKVPDEEKLSQIIEPTEKQRREDVIAGNEIDDDGFHDFNTGSPGDVSQANEMEDEELSSVELERRTCDLCVQVFSNFAEMSKHRKTHCKEERMKCQICGKLMPSDKSYETHVKTHTDNVHPCALCGKILSSTSSLRVHLLTHEEPKFCCQICGKTTRTQPKLKSHMQIHSDDRPFKCEKCGQQFKLKGTLKQHLRIHSQSPTFICELCGYTVHRRAHLKLHMNTSHKNGEYSNPNMKHPCSKCNMKFVHKYNLTRHQVAAHGVEPTEIVGPKSLAKNAGIVLPMNLLCIYCNIQFPDKGALQVHKKEIHQTYPKKGQEGKTDYSCPHCEHILHSKRSLLYHIRSHTGERPFLCKICGEGFKSATAAQSHEWHHTNHRPYKCNVCNKAFFAYSNLYQHKLIHATEKQFKCDQCAFKAYRPAALKIHMRVHTGEKPYACDLCDRSYKSSWDLRIHKRIHTGEAPYRRLRTKSKKSKLMVEDSGSYNLSDNNEAVPYDQHDVILEEVHL